MWSFAAAINQGDRRYNGGLICPCTDTNFNWPHQVPSFVGSNYFCDTADLDSVWTYSKYCVDNPLWDGSSCCEFNTPPAPCIYTSLPQSITDDMVILWCVMEIIAQAMKTSLYTYLRFINLPIAVRTCYKYRIMIVHAHPT